MVIVSGREFVSKKALYEHVKAIVEQTAHAEIAAESEFLLHMICERHENPDAKVIPGMESEIVGVRVRHQSSKDHPVHSGSNHTFVAYASGMEIDFSWVKCCHGRFGAAEKARSAMRRAVQGDIVAYKKFRYLAGPVTSDASGLAIAWGESQVDHWPVTFQQLRDQFLQERGLALSDIEVIDDPKGGHIMADRELLTSWQLFHQANSTLRLVTVDENKTSWRKESCHE